MPTSNIYDLTDTWNNVATTFTAFKMNVTDTASNTASLLMDLQVGGATLFNVSKSGHIRGIASATNYLFQDDTATWSFSSVGFGGVPQTSVKLGSFQLPSSGFIGFCQSTSSNGTVDTSVRRTGVGFVGVRGSSASVGAALDLIEQTAPAAPATNGVYIYAEDNGGGKTRLMARFATGAAQQIAIEP
jgi:hypothetical protein